MSEQELMRLAERCEAATGADRELDAAIYDCTPHALDYQRIGIQVVDRSRFDRYHDGWVTVYAAKGEADPYPEDLPRYTASLDAAMALVPKGGDGWSLSISEQIPPPNTAAYVWWQRGYTYAGKANTPALALCAAALRARAAQC